MTEAKNAEWLYRREAREVAVQHAAKRLLHLSDPEDKTETDLKEILFSLWDHVI